MGRSGGVGVGVPNGGKPPVNPVKEPPKETGKDGPKETQPVGLVGGSGPVSKKEIYKSVLKSVCMIRTLLDTKTGAGAVGSGQLIDRENRLVLTNYHVVHGQQDFIVLFPEYDKDGKVIAEKDVYMRKALAEGVVKGKVLSHDKTHDCALIQLNHVPDGVDAIPFAKEEPAEGDNLHSVGNAGVSGSVFVYTPGVVRKVYKKTYTSHGPDFEVPISSRIIEATSPTNGGDSGGPCVNDRGELVGITQGGLVGLEASMSYFIERSELENFINRTFESVPELKGKRWVRSTRPPLVPNNTQAMNLPTYVSQLKSPDDTVRAQGVQGLLTLGPDAHPAIRFLVEALGDKNPFVAQLAANALRQIGQPVPEDLQYLLPALESTSPDAKAYVLEALVTLGQSPEAEPAKDNVLKLTEDPNSKVRQRAMFAVGSMAQVVGDKKAREALEKGLKDSDKRVRAAAALAVTTNTSMKNEVDKLKELLNGKEPEVRAPAALALGKLGDRAKAVVPDLLVAIREDDRQLKRACYIALKSVGADPQTMMSVLRAGIKDGDVQVRRAALEAAGRAGAAAKDLLPTIVDALSDSDVRQAALSALKQLGPEAKEHAPAVANLLGTDKILRMETLNTLEAMKPAGPTAPLVVPKVIAVFEDEKQEPVREKAAELLSHIGRVAIPDLTTALSNPNWMVREGAGKSLAAMPSEARLALARIQAAWNAETNAKAKETLADCLKRALQAPPPKP
jgi:HEAT repeat protein/S1-C subfamily serine protease